MSWDELRRPAPESIDVGGVEIRRGTRVRLHPRAGADVFDLALAGRTATVQSIEADMDGGVHVVVTVDDDPGRDLGIASQLAHRFFFSPEEIEPLPPRRILVAGIGNVFLGDDGFGVVLAERLAAAPLPVGVEVVDFGIRGMDLAYALGDGYDAVVLLDAAPTGHPPGTLSLIEPETGDIPPAVDAHGMDPVKVLGLARTLGGPLPRTLVLACAPQTVLSGDEPELVAELSAPVQAALEPAVEMVQSLLIELTSTEETEVRPP